MKKIALIEDDTDLYSLLKYNLEKEGFTLVGSQTGKGAIELCRRERPDLILLDIMLPDSDGLDICKGIRSHRANFPRSVPHGTKSEYGGRRAACKRTTDAGVPTTSTGDSHGHGSAGKRCRAQGAEQTLGGASERAARRRASSTLYTGADALQQPPVRSSGRNGAFDE